MALSLVVSLFLALSPFFPSQRGRPPPNHTYLNDRKRQREKDRETTAQPPREAPPTPREKEIPPPNHPYLNDRKRQRERGRQRQRPLRNYPERPPLPPTPGKRDHYPTTRDPTTHTLRERNSYVSTSCQRWGRRSPADGHPCRQSTTVLYRLSFTANLTVSRPKGCPP